MGEISDITVSSQTKTATGYVFMVAVDAYQYKVTLTDNYYQKVAGSEITPEELIQKSFKFLLEREGPEQILSEFDLPLIGRYFPEYEDTIKNKT